MKYRQYTTEDFIKDEYFQKWALDNDPMTNNFWNNWLARNPNKKEEVEKAKKVVQLMGSDEDRLPEDIFDAMWQNIIERRGKSQQYVQKPYQSTKTIGRAILRVAAIFIGLIALSYGVYQSGFFEIENDPQGTIPQVTLVLQDGTIKTIDESASGIITTASGTNVVNQQQHVLLYNDSKDSDEEETLTYNQLMVPYGKKFELILSDGSHVFLNSGSKLRYPVKFFKDRPRDVFLDGEAYFSVAKDPENAFTVVTDDMNTKVYGTEFNVSSYKNEHNTFTVLVEGSVGVYRSNNDEGEQPLKIIPGQRAVFKNGKIDVEKINANKYVAWKEGKLFFVDDRFELILKELERNFNVRIDNRFTELNDKKFTGTFTLEESLEQILDICREHTPFEYERKGNMIIIIAN